MKHTRTTPAKLRAKGSTTLAAQLVEMRKSRDEFRSQAKFYRERLEQEANNLQYAEDKASEVMDLRRELERTKHFLDVACANHQDAEAKIFQLQFHAVADRSKYRQRKGRHVRDVFKWKCVAFASQLVGLAILYCYVFAI